MNVKQERSDDSEIQALADKIMEASKSRMVNQKAHSVTPQMNMNKFIVDTKIKLSAPTSPMITASSTTNSLSGDDKLIDEDSIRGKFGWETIGNSPIPYISRQGEKYCAVRVVEMKVLNKYLNFLHQDIYNCTCIRSYYITEAESRLLNEINFKHCDCQFGRDHFTQLDLVVRLSDVIEFYNFLGSCYTKLVSGETDALGRSGFIRINKESVVPYTVYNNQKYVPLFYFEGETDNLKQRANKLEGWDLAYLKFCCKVQGIRNELFSHDSCSVISLDNIKSFFPPGTMFEDYWPKKSADSQLLINGNNTRNQAQIIKWTRQPTQPAPLLTPPSPKTTINQQQQQQKTTNQMLHSYSSYNLTHPYQQHPTRTTGTTVRTTYQTPSTRHMRSPNYYSNIAAQGPPPLVPTIQQTVSKLFNNNTTTNASHNYFLSADQTNLNHNYQDDNDHPLPMIPIRQFLANGGQIMPNYLRQQQVRYNMDAVGQNTAQRDLNSYGVSTRQGLLINHQPAHQQTPRTPTFNDDHNLTNGQMTIDDLNCKLITIAEPPTSSNHIPYKMQKALVDTIMLPCINMKPYVNTDLLVTLPDLIMNFFHGISVQSCQRVMKVLGIDLYKPNTSQTHVLMDAGKCQSINDVVPLVQIRHVIENMPQLKYMLSGLLPSMSKRPRNS